MGIELSSIRLFVDHCPCATRSGVIAKTRNYPIYTENNLRLIKQPGYREETWICEQRCPTGTWKNRPLWKPMTKPLHRAALEHWLSRRFPAQTNALPLTEFLG